MMLRTNDGSLRKAHIQVRHLMRAAWLPRTVDV